MVSREGQLEQVWGGRPDILGHPVQSESDIDGVRNNMYNVLEDKLNSDQAVRGELTAPAEQPSEYTECWPCLLFDILLNKYYPAG
jgi:hypothetical protein